MKRSHFKTVTSDATIISHNRTFVNRAAKPYTKRQIAAAIPPPVISPPAKISTSCQMRFFGNVGTHSCPALCLMIRAASLTISFPSTASHSRLGDIYIGVVGPVRTGKSTFITRFMEKMVIPNISNKLQKQIATDEMPQSADGKTIMTTQPKFVPANGVKVQFKNKSTANVRLVDCVGYFVDGAVGHEEDNKPRLVKTPWSDKEIPFESAAEIGTKKVIDEYSTIGIVVTTDGSIGEIARESYIQPENRVIKELKALKKPFVIVLNSKSPESEQAIKLAVELENKHGVPVLCLNVDKMNNDDISAVMEKVLLEFPMRGLNVNIPKWMQALPSENPVIQEIISGLKDASSSVVKMSDFTAFNDLFNDNDKFEPIELRELKLGDGFSELEVKAKDGLYFNVLSNECGEQINDDFELINYIKSFAAEKRKFAKIKDALSDAEENGYGEVRQ